MTRRYPRLLEIRNAVYSVCTLKRMKDDDAGMCDDGNKMILLSKNQDARELWKTYWHEILHGVEKEFKINLGHKRIRALEEAIVSVLEQEQDLGEDPKLFFTVHD